MLQYIVKRLLLAIPILVAVVTLVFFVVRMAPGDPAQVILGDSASQESLTALRAELGLDRPILVQYGEFLFSIIKGDLGNSIIRKQSINSMIAEVLPYTIELTLAGVLAFAGTAGRCASALTLAGVTAYTLPFCFIATAGMCAGMDGQGRCREQCSGSCRQRNAGHTVFLLH